MPFQHLLLDNLNLDPDILVNSNIRHDPGQREKRKGYGSGRGNRMLTLFIDTRSSRKGKVP